MATAAKLARINDRKTVQPMTGRLLTSEEVSSIVGLSIETLAQWRSQKRGIPYLKISRNCVRYRQADLDAWLQERIVPVEQDPSNARRNY
jgi:predicted DNA-binding transcriptional regulator AlpA